MAREDEGFLIEIRPVGGAVKVSAIDPDTGTEVSIVGSPKASKHDLSRLAARKLRYVLERDSGAEQPAEETTGKGKGVVA